MRAVASEHEMMFETGWALLGSIKTLRDLPLVVIASGVPNPEFGASASEFQQYWRESSEALVELSTRGRFVFLEDSTHNIPGDAPEATCCTCGKDKPVFRAYCNIHGLWKGE